jgi:mRNA-degrading endonuclease RelE of RelBE toxin-antitoxin system
MRLLEFTEEAKKDLAKLEKSTARQVFSKLRWLVENFDSLSQEPLTGDLRGSINYALGNTAPFIHSIGFGA